MIIAYSRKFSTASLPSTSMTSHFDFSDISTLYKTYTNGNNPAYTDVATADADTIQIARSIFPVSTSDWTFPYRTNEGPTTSPVLRLTTPLLGTQCLDFDGSNDRLLLCNRTGTQLAVSNIFANNAKTAILSFRCESLPASNGVFQPLFADQSSNFTWGMYIYNNAGTVQLLVQHFDGSYDSLFHGTIAADTNYVAVMRHDGTNIYASLNNDTETSTASGNTSDMTQPVYLAGCGNASFLNGRIGEIVTYNAALTGSNLSDAITYFMNKWT